MSRPSARAWLLSSSSDRSWSWASRWSCIAQNRFWAMHDHLLAHDHDLSDEELRSHARALGLDMTAYERDMRDPALAERVRGDALSGLHSGVQGTPPFFLNGRRLEGGFPGSELIAAIRATRAA